MATEIATKGHRGLGWLLALTVAALVTLGPARPEAAAPIGCGAVLTGQQTYTLTRDVGPCFGAGPAITVVGPASLKLNGWTVSCVHDIRFEFEEGDPVPFPFTEGIPGSVGIALVGAGADLQGGVSYTGGANPSRENRVLGCDQNVLVKGEGNHQVKGVTSTQSLTGAFVVTSNRNALTGNVVRQQVIAPEPARPVKCGGSAFTIGGDYNGLYKNVAADCLENGFQIDGDQNRVEDNLARDNDGVGYQVDGKWNWLRGNGAAKNITDGFVVGREGKGNTLSHNLSSENGDGDLADGFEVQGTNNVLKSNTAENNGERGIYLSWTAWSNVVTENAVSRSGVSDLVDDKAQCGTNQWYGNIFGTRSRSCIK